MGSSINIAADRQDRKATGGWSRHTTANLGLLLVALVLDAVAIHRNSQELHHSFERANHTQQTLSLAEQILESLTAAESGVRGYVATGLPEFLENHDRCLQVMPSLRERLRDQFEQDSSYAKPITTIERQIDEKLAHLDAMRSLRTNVSGEAATAKMAKQEGRVFMNNIRESLSELRRETEQELAERLAETRWRYYTILVANIIGISAVTGICAWAWWTIDREIDRSQQAEMTAQLEREHLHVILESIGDGVIVTNAEGRIEMLNPIARQLTGHSDEAIGKSLFESFSIIHEQTREVVANPVREALDRGLSVTLENHTLLIRTDGMETPIEDSASPIRDGAGQIIGAVLVFRDCTPRWLYERKIRQSEAQFRRMAEGVPSMVWTATPHGDVDYVNTTMLTFTGTQFQDLVGKGWADYVHPDDVEMAKKAWQQSLQTGDPLSIELRWIGGDGSSRWYLARANPIRDEEGRIAQWLGTNTDIHDQKQAAMILANEHQRKDEFLAMLAHELRNPLTPIANAVQVMEATQYDPEQAARLVPLINRQVNQLKRLIDDLLDVARITQGRIILRRQRCAVQPIVHEAVESTQSLINDKQHQLIVNVPTETLWLQADAQRLTQVLTNLLINAAKYTEPAGKITLTVEADESWVEFRVRDTGVGLDPRAQSKIFNLFMQVEHSLDRSQGGLGIGLSLVRSLVELHGGSVSVSSPGLGCGSEFSVRIPWNKPAVEEITPPQETMTTDTSPLDILVVDDVQASAKTMALMLTAMGHRATTAFDGHDALQKIAALKLDVVFMDIAMPGMDGFEVLRKIRETHPADRLFAVALTGFGQEQDRLRSQTAGFNEHLTKPVGMDQVKSLLAGVPRSGDAV